jgi:cell division transport system permease protein
MWYLFEESFSNIRHGGFVSLLSVVIVTLTVTIASALILIGNYLQGEIENLKDRPAIIIFLKDTIGESEGQEFRSQIEKLDWASSVIYVSKKEALARSEEMFGDFGKTLTEGFSDSNPFPASLEIYIQETLLEPDKLSQFTAQLRSFTHQVEDVTSEQASSEFMRKVEMVLTGLGGLMGAASVIIVCFSIMLTAYFRREEIRVMRLVGATYWYIRIPLIAQGVFLGFIGSFSGILSFYVLFRLFVPRITEIQFIPWDQLGLILLGGVLLGLLGSIAPIRRYVNV